MIFPKKARGEKEEDKVTNRPESSDIFLWQCFHKAKVQNTEIHQGHQELGGLQASRMLVVHKGTQEQVQGEESTVGPPSLQTREPHFKSR